APTVSTPLIYPPTYPSPLFSTLLILLCSSSYLSFFSFFFFNDTATTEIYTLSLHDALPIYAAVRVEVDLAAADHPAQHRRLPGRSEEHTSELQSRENLVCRLLLEKKKKKKKNKKT